ncbi:tol-pal system-associated acyl-CoA thioesterase [Vibrio sp. vnigr-6D03]|nr:tol-pal system-associated acyl-CoA thioesterase [Vibrio sp. vnigr-6D03]RTZ23317.1 tol-pal system-associated acyl-CoA thioesterase [Vibrio penaeicida]
MIGVLVKGEFTRIFEWSIRVYYEDTDAGGLVYHSNYLNYFERARTELLRSLGVCQQRLLTENFGFVIRHVEMDFLQGARLDDQLTVRTSISELRRASLVFCQELVNPDGKTLCRATVKVAFVNTKTMKPQAIPSSMTAELIDSDS